jgi:hypothetical protein
MQEAQEAQEASQIAQAAGSQHCAVATVLVPAVSVQNLTEARHPDSRQTDNQVLVCSSQCRSAIYLSAGGGCPPHASHTIAWVCMGQRCSGGCVAHYVVTD